jgi:hypothetical protein
VRVRLGQPAHQVVADPLLFSVGQPHEKKPRVGARSEAPGVREVEILCDQHPAGGLRGAPHVRVGLSAQVLFEHPVDVKPNPFEPGPSRNRDVLAKTRYRCRSIPRLRTSHGEIAPGCVLSSSSGAAPCSRTSLREPTGLPSTRTQVLPASRFYRIGDLKSASRANVLLATRTQVLPASRFYRIGDLKSASRANVLLAR